MDNNSYFSKKRCGYPLDNTSFMENKNIGCRYPLNSPHRGDSNEFPQHMLFYEKKKTEENWAASSEFGTYRLCEQRMFRRACASAQSRQNLRCSLIQAASQEEPSDRKPDPWSLWTAGHAQLKFVMTECSKTQIRLTRPNYRLIIPLSVFLKVLFVVNMLFLIPFILPFVQCYFICWINI